jgi:hypothetical protein
VRRDWLKRQIEAGKMEAKTCFHIEHDGDGRNDVYGGEWMTARIRHPKFRQHYPDRENRPEFHYGVCDDPDFIEGQMNFNESDFSSGCGACYRSAQADGSEKFTLHVHSNAVYYFRLNQEEKANDPKQSGAK